MDTPTASPARTAITTEVTPTDRTVAAANLRAAVTECHELLSTSASITVVLPGPGLSALRARLAFVAALLGLLAVLTAPAEAAAPSPGVGLGLFASSPEWDYGPLIDEIAALGVDGVLMVVPWYQRDVRSTLIRPRPGFSPSLATVKRTLEQLAQAGLAATVMPIVLLEVQEHPRQWRGVIAPERFGKPAVERWFGSYRDFLLALASLAAQTGAERVIVGSELLSMEGERALWLDLIARTRRIFEGELIYSANWDQYNDVTFWEALDGIGVNGYFRLAADDANPTTDEIVAAWEGPLKGLAKLRGEVGLPLLISEVGYSSRVTAAAKPWCACTAETIDHELQSQLYSALMRVFVQGELTKSGEAPLPFDRWFLWNWFGQGGREDGTFSPRGKPAEVVLRKALGDREPQGQ